MKIRTLFIEDEQRGVTPYFKELERNDFQCDLARDGDEAIKKLDREDFDLVSMDVMFPPGKSLNAEALPVNAGLRLLQQIRQGNINNCDPNINVIILTAVIDREIEKEIQKLGVDAYLKKPIDFNEVIETFCRIKSQNIKEQE